MNTPSSSSRLADALPEEFREVSGSQLARILARILEARSTDDQDGLDRELQQWVRRMREQFEPTFGILDEGLLRFIALAPGESAAVESAENLITHVARERGVPADLAADFLRRIVADSRGARRARNLIKHRRKCVSAILAVLDVVDTRTTRRVRDLSASSIAERDAIGAIRIDGPKEYHEWATRTFELFASAWREEWSSERPFPESLLNNYRTEWMDFVNSMPLEFKSHGSLVEAALESAFERRFARSLHELRMEAEERNAVTSRAARYLRSAPKSTFSDWPMALALPEASQRSATPQDVAKPRLELKTGPRSSTMLIGAEIIGNRDIDQLAMRLGLELTEPGDPTEILVRVITQPAPVIEVTVQTSDRARVQSVFMRAQHIMTRG